MSNSRGQKTHNKYQIIELEIYTYLYIFVQITACEIHEDRTKMSEMDVVLFHGRPKFKDGMVRPANQVWALYMLESPYHTPPLDKAMDLFNWTATYR